MSDNSYKHGDNIILFIVIIASCVLFLDRLIPEGMFLDGVTYASISRNLAIGKGGLWNLDFRGETVFSEHPPFMFWIQSLFFRILGDHYLTEKIYCFILSIITVLSMHTLWQRTKGSNTGKYSFAYVLLAWALTPVLLWGYTNNLLDATMALFNIAAIYVVFRMCQYSEVKYLQAVVAGLLTFLAIFTKGPTGAFPLAAPVLYYIAYHGIDKKMLIRGLIYSVIMTATVAVIIILLRQYQPAAEYYQRYMNQQVLAALQGEREITTGKVGRWFLLIELSINIVPVIAVSGIIYLIARLTKTKASFSTNNKAIIFFLLVAASGSLPMLLSVKQRSFYLIPSLTFYIIAIALTVHPLYVSLINKWQVSKKAYNYFKVIAVLAIIGLSFYLAPKVGKPGRDHEVIADIKQLSELIPEGSRMGMCDATEYEYGFMSYLQRYNRMEKAATIYEADYALLYREICDEDFEKVLKSMGYKQVGKELPKYTIYRRSFPIQFDFMSLNPVFLRADK